MTRRLRFGAKLRVPEPGLFRPVSGRMARYPWPCNMAFGLLSWSAMQVLLTTDGSKEAAAAMRAAARLLSPVDRKVDVLYVIPELRAPKSGKIARKEYQHRLAGETKRVLEGAKQILAEEGVDALTLSETGSPA